MRQIGPSVSYWSMTGPERTLAAQRAQPTKTQTPPSGICTEGMQQNKSGRPPEQTDPELLLLSLPAPGPPLLLLPAQVQHSTQDEQAQRQANPQVPTPHRASCRPAPRLQHLQRQRSLEEVIRDP
jgi:hypothetical protein